MRLSAKVMVIAVGGLAAVFTVTGCGRKSASVGHARGVEERGIPARERKPQEVEDEAPEAQEPSEGARIKAALAGAWTGKLADGGKLYLVFEPHRPPHAKEYSSLVVGSD